MTAGWIVSAYVTSPPDWDSGAHAEFLDAIAGVDGVAGFELPYPGCFHRRTEDWMPRRVDLRRSYTVTTIPDTMHHLAGNRAYGLASTDPSGRAAAIARAARAAAAVRRCNDAAGAPVVRAVTVYSAPRARAGLSSEFALAESLAEITEFGWDGARLIVEHCDAPTVGRRAVKGFLQLDGEISAVLATRRRTGHAIGIGVNWGRSVVERRTRGGAEEHLAMARSAGTLAGFTVSGCAPVATPYGDAWDDTHVPPAPICPASVLTADAVVSALRAAGPGPFLRGIKVSAAAGADLATRISTIARTVQLVRQSNAEAERVRCPISDSSTSRQT